MLPLWTRISRVTDDSNDPCSSKFYRLSSCDLIDGTVEVEFQESAFSRGISEALAASGLARETTSVSSVAVVTPTVTQGSPSERTTQVGSSVDMGPENRRLSGAVEQAKSSISRDDHAAIADKLSVFETLLTEDQRRKQQHRPKNRLGLKQRSKRKHHQKLRKPGRHSTRVTHAQPGNSQFLKAFMQRPDVVEALRLLRRERAAALHAASANTMPAQLVGQCEVTNDEDDPDTNDSISVENDTVADCEITEKKSRIATKEPVEWPPDVTRVYKKKNPNGIRFKNIGNLGKCECIGDCYIDECMNSRSDVYCSKQNCAIQWQCGNSVKECLSLKLFETVRCGLGVYTTDTVEVGTIVGEYCGVLESYRGLDTTSAEPATLKNNTGYSLLLNQRATDGQFVYIEAEKTGSIMRFLNHSCNPNCRFREMQYRKQVVVVVVTLRKILPTEELTVSYAGKLWFTCSCKKCSKAQA
ncbi:SET domain-containing protein [Phytophthora infestans]|uniref:SET domain-containing protein n=1 Tax=Phytophthora infestans TaxID=4787 RepID=A0A8S9V4D4_PHYIN|nr:SET domain-containing protein [Phytophthora infestans]